MLTFSFAVTMDLHFFIWLLGMIENYDERSRHDDVECLVALVCAYHLQHRDEPQNPVTEALKMAQGHALLECSLLFLSKHGEKIWRLKECQNIILLLLYCLWVLVGLYVFHRVSLTFYYYSDLGFFFVCWIRFAFIEKSQSQNQGEPCNQMGMLTKPKSWIVHSLKHYPYTLHMCMHSQIHSNIHMYRQQ